MRQSRTLLFAAILIVSGRVAHAQWDPLYLSRGGSMVVLQHGVIINGWAFQHVESSVFAVAGDVRTLGDPGSQYTLAGAFTGTSYPFDPALAPIPGGDFPLDGTTNGASHFVPNLNTGEIYATDRNWANPQVLFTVMAGNLFGITYDKTNNSLWISRSGAGGSTITDYTMTGTELFSFHPLPASDGDAVDARALAYDPGDQSLWFSDNGFHDFTTDNLYQYSTKGALLSMQELGGGFNGGEFNTTTTPEPASVSLVIIGVLGLGCVARQRRRNP